MPVLFFDHTKICIVCGHAKPNCTCDKHNLRPCKCNPCYNAGGWPDCPDCGGRGWTERKKEN